MIEKLRRKFIGICVISFVSVFVLVFGLIFLITTIQTNQNLDMHTDIISQNGGSFPDFSTTHPDADKPHLPAGFNKESPFTTRYFTVSFNKLGDALYADVRQVSGVDEKEAVEYAAAALEENSERGWVGDYRYKVCDSEIGKTVIFVSGVSAKESNRNFLLSALAVFTGCSVLIIILIILISGRAVKPAAESYEKQKQFITNANHELKTPITLIRTNLDILEDEVGENEWLTDIREETLLMSELVNRMVKLARMDEDSHPLEISEFSLSDVVTEVASAFSAPVLRAGKRLILNIADNIRFSGDESAIREVISILLDNALKYCDSGGEISLSLAGEKHPVIEVENDFADVANTELSRLFDRFYRADKARTSGGGFGIGLSMAKATVEKSGGAISAQSVDGKKIKFRVKL